MMRDELRIFDYDAFMRLQMMELVNYVEPFLVDPRLFDVVPIIFPGTLERIAAELSGYDVPHLVYGMELGMAYRPDLFADQLPAYLDHPEMSVRGAACRCLRRLTPEQITDKLIEDVKAALAASPEARQIAVGVPDIMPELLEKLEAERRSDTRG